MTMLLFLCIRFYKDCSIRLMDVDKDVRRSYQELIKALPTDLLTRFVMIPCAVFRIYSSLDIEMQASLYRQIAFRI